MSRPASLGPGASNEASLVDGSLYGAMSRGRAALRAGDRHEAVLWLERAARLAPTDWSVTFLLASALAGIDDARTHDLLRDTVEAQPLARAPRIALVAAALHAGRPGDAVAALHALLTLFAIPEGTVFAALATQVCGLAGAPGWCGLDGEGQVVVVVRLPPVRRVTVMQGGAVVATVRARDRRPLPLSTPGLVEAHAGGQALLGSGLDPARRFMTQGCVEMNPDGSLRGWAWTPWNPGAIPRLTILPPDAAPFTILADDDSMPMDDGGLAMRRAFHVDQADLPQAGLLRVLGQDGTDLSGSPVCIDQLSSRWAAAAVALVYPVLPGPSGGTGPIDRWRPLPVAALTEPAVDAGGPVPRRRAIDIVIPVFRGAADLVACLRSLRRGLPVHTRIVIVDDHTPDPALRTLLDDLVGSGRVTVLRHDRNLGFPSAANTGFRHAMADPAQPRDVLLLNSDTLAPPRLLMRLARLAYGAARIGSVTPLTNDGTIVSLSPGPAVPPAGPVETDRLDALAAAANGTDAVDIPTAMGFCMFIRHDCLAMVGAFRDDAFAQGYGEENDWSLRARHLGWRHVVAPGIFVAHAGGQSFGPAKQGLMDRNGRLLERLHPGYDRHIADFQARDPLAPARRRIAERQWTGARLGEGSVVIVSHGLGGGVHRFLGERCAQFRTQGLRPIVITPGPSTGCCAVSDGISTEDGMLLYHLPDEWPALLALLAADRPRWVELHHLLGHAHELVSVADRLGVRYDVFVHDAHLWCPRITLCGKTGAYCGEPTDVAECEACIDEAGTRLKETIGVAALRDRSDRLLTAARRVFAPTQDAAARVARYSPRVKPFVLPWEPEPAWPAAAPATKPHDRADASRAVVVLVAGAVGVDKGYAILLRCARDAERRGLPLRFVVAGHTMDDDVLMRTGRVFITGAYQETEAVALMRGQAADFGFIPSVCPETWCYAMSELWRAELDVVAFNLGAQAERIRRSGRGVTVPLGLPTARLNDELMRFGTMLRTRPSSTLRRAG